MPANGLVPLDVGAHVRRRAHVSAAIHARRGRIVVEALQIHNGDGRRGVGLMLGLPRTATSFVFPDGIASPERFEQLHLFNPNDAEASVQLDLVLDAGDAQPFQLRVPAQGRITVDLTSESRVPKNVGHALVVRVSNNVAARRGAHHRRRVRRAPGAATSATSARPAPRCTGASLPAAPRQALDEWIAVHQRGATRCDGQRRHQRRLRARLPAGSRQRAHPARRRDRCSASPTTAPLLKRRSSSTPPGPSSSNARTYRNGGTGASPSWAPSSRRRRLIW